MNVSPRRLNGSLFDSGTRHYRGVKPKVGDGTCFEHKRIRNDLAGSTPAPSVV